MQKFACKSKTINRDFVTLITIIKTFATFFFLLVVRRMTKSHPIDKISFVDLNMVKKGILAR